LPSQRPPSNEASSSPASTSAPSSSGAKLLPTLIDASKMDEKSQQIYLLKVEVQDVTQRLERKDLGEKELI